MRINPETNHIILGHESIAASSVLATSAACNLENAEGALVLCTYTLGDAVDVTLTMDEGESATVAKAGTYKITTGAEFPIWTMSTAQSADTWVKQTDAITFVLLNGTYTGTTLVVFDIKAASLTNSRSWIHLCSAGAASGILGVHYILYGVRYQQADPLSARG
jgi:hypothetical protein